MPVVMMRFAAPLQSWGAQSRYAERRTEDMPTKSAIVGLLAAALGRCRDEDVSDLATLEMCIREDQRGRVVWDFQTAVPAAGKPLPLSRRAYLSDAVFTVALACDKAMAGRIRDALLHPAFPLYLGRRSCPPDDPVLLEVIEDTDDPRAAISSYPSQASPRYHRRHEGEALRVLADAQPLEQAEFRHDSPESFSDKGRSYSLRRVVRTHVAIAADGAGNDADPFDYL